MIAKNVYLVYCTLQFHHAANRCYFLTAWTCLPVRVHSPGVVGDVVASAAVVNVPSTHNKVILLKAKAKTTDMGTLCLVDPTKTTVSQLFIV